jgi:hypothetical protein
MIAITSLWLPIVLSAALVWIASALVWTVLPHRRKEFRGLPDEEAARNALRAAPGEYSIPYAADASAMKDPEHRRKMEEGPVAYVRVVPSGGPSMGRPMALSFLYYLVIGVVVAYLTSRTLDPGAHYLSVFRVAGAVAWTAHFFAAVPDSIWFGKPWTSTAKLFVESLVYGLLTAGSFGALWPGS